MFLREGGAGHPRPGREPGTPFAPSRPGEVSLGAEGPWQGRSSRRLCPEPLRPGLVRGGGERERGVARPAPAAGHPLPGAPPGPSASARRGAPGRRVAGGLTADLRPRP